MFIIPQIYKIMRQLTKFDVILHKVGINTPCFIYWSKPTAEEVVKNLQYNKSVEEYRRKCIVKYPGITHDFTGEYEIYLKMGLSPKDAWLQVMVEFANK